MGSPALKSPHEPAPLVISMVTGAGAVLSSWTSFQGVADRSARRPAGLHRTQSWPLPEVIQEPRMLPTRQPRGTFAVKLTQPVTGQASAGRRINGDVDSRVDVERRVMRRGAHAAVRADEDAVLDAGAAEQAGRRVDDMAGESSAAPNGQAFATPIAGTSEVPVARPVRVADGTVGMLPMDSTRAATGNGRRAG